MQNIINKDKHDINDIPDDNPSSPSIKLIALAIPTIHPTVKIMEKASLNPILYKNGIFDNNDNEIANNTRRVTIPNENKQNKNRKKNNDTRF